MPCPHFNPHGSVALPSRAGSKQYLDSRSAEVMMKKDLTTDF